MAKNISNHIHTADPYEGLDVLPLDAQGWNSDGESFSNAIEATNAKTIIEVGTWKGGSAFTMTEAALRLFVLILSWVHLNIIQRCVHFSQEMDLRKMDAPQFMNNFFRMWFTKATKML